MANVSVLVYILGAWVVAQVVVLLWLSYLKEQPSSSSSRSSLINKGTFNDENDDMSIESDATTEQNGSGCAAQSVVGWEQFFLRTNLSVSDTLANCSVPTFRGLNDCARTTGNTYRQCLEKAIENYERLLQYVYWRGSMCGTSASNCKIDARRILSEHRMKQCASLRFDPAKHKIDVVIPWRNFSETGYFDSFDKSAVTNFVHLRKNLYANVGARRPAASEVVFALRSLLKHGFMQQFVGKVYILYDDDLQGPPTFLEKWGQSQVVAMPISVLATGTKFVSRRRRLQANLAYLHHLPGLSDYFLFMPDDCIMLRNSSLKDFIRHDGTVVVPAGGVVTVQRIQENMRGIAEAISTVVGRTFPLQYDMHAPMMVKKCYCEELEARLACNDTRHNIYECDPLLPTTTCNFPTYHFQFFLTNYQRFRGEYTTQMNQPMQRSEIHTNAGRYEYSLASTLINLMRGTPPLWLNLQGDGVSDEYARNDRIRETVDDWYFTYYPDAAFWEIPDFFMPYKPKPLTASLHVGARQRKSNVMPRARDVRK